MKRTSFFGFSLLLLSMLFWGCEQKAAYIRLNPLFTDHVVLQRDIEVPIWGKASPGEMLTVKLGKEVYEVQAAQDSTWQVELSPRKAGGPYRITVSGEKDILLKDVMFGDVWICSGQSNMDWPVERAANAEKEIETADYPEIRLLKADYETSLKPVEEIKAGTWETCSPSTVPEFSAVGYFFGRQIYKDMGVPIGLIHIAWGGTPAEAWTSKEALANFPAFKNEITVVENSTQSKAALIAEYEQEMELWRQSLLASDSVYPLWAQERFNDDTWRRAYLPTKLEDMRGTESTGVYWFRRKFTLPEDWNKDSLTVGLGKINNYDHFFWNGQQIGFSDRNFINRKYKVPSNLVKEENTLVLRITNLSGSGGIMDNYSEFSIGDNQGNKTLLAGYWKYAPSVEASDVPKRPLNPIRAGRPTVLYKSMVHPLLPFAMRGVIWYQGEANASRAAQYKKLFPALIEDWREKWAQAGSQIGDFPFLYVQLANFLQRDQVPRNDPWPQLREAQLQTLSVPNTGMAIAIDLGETNNIHPANKQDVGKRLALNALKFAYFKDTVYSGPIYQSMVVEEGQIRLTFAHIGDGLQIGKSANSTEEKLRGFAIAGSNQQFVWADAKIEGETIVVKSPLVRKPVAVRYAWSNNPIANLYNKNGLPASPFRTDDF